MGAGRNTTLSPAEEDELATCLKVLSEWGFGMTRRETQEVVGDYVSHLKRNTSFVGGLPGEDWMSGFLKRHPDLTCRLPEQMKVSRQKSSANKVIYTAWFDLLEKVLSDNNLKDKPERIYNVDESGFPLDPRRLKVITKKGIQNLFRLIGGSGRETITVQGCARADGLMLPPYVLYAAKNLRLKWTEDGPDGARYNVSDKGWMDTDCFNDWFSKFFIPFLPPGRPVVLIFDGHASHLSYKTVEHARKENIIILKLPSNSTHALQPLDVGVYGPVKTAWEGVLVRFARQNLGTALSKELFPSLLRSLWHSDCMSSQNVKAGFRRCGIMPLDRSAIPESVYAGAELFDRPDPGVPSTSSDPLPPPSIPSASSDPSPLPSTSSDPSPLPSTLTDPSPPPSTSTDPSPLPSTSSDPSPLPSTSTDPSPPPSTLTDPSPLPSTSSDPSVPSTSTDPSPPPSVPSTSTDPPSPPPSVPSTSSDPSPSPSLPSQSTPPTIKDFFLKRLTPMMKSKSTTANRQRAIKRQYGESLTSVECIERLQREEEERAAKKSKGRGKGKGKKTVTPVTTMPARVAPTLPEQEESDSDGLDDSDSDPDWVPSRAEKTMTRMNLFDKFTI